MKFNDIEKQEKLLKNLEHDPVAFIELFLDRTLSPKQQLFLKKTRNKKHVIAIWSRQTGKSTVIASYIVWRLLYGKGHVTNGEHTPERIAIVAPIKDQIMNLYKKIKSLVDKSEFIASFVIKMNSATIEMKNGNEAKMMSASPGSQIRGYTATCIIIDESQDITDEKYSADILPFGATTNALVIEAGTPKTKNHFYNALNSKNVTVIKQPWYECPFLSEEYVMSQKELSTEALWRQEYLCFAPNTYIIGEKPKKIIDIKEGDKVYNNKGNLVEVKSLLKHYIEEKVLKITIWNGNSFVCTKNHPIYSSIRTGAKNWSIDKLTFNNAEHLKPKDFIHYPKLHSVNHKIKELKLSDYIKECIKEGNTLRSDCTSKSNYIYDKIPLNKEVLRLFGLWVAEGSVGAKSKQLQFSFGSHEKHLIKEVQKSILKYFRKETALKLKNKSKSSTQIITNNKILCDFFVKMFGKGANNKKIPDIIFKLNKEQIAWFLSGYYDGNGHDSRTKFICSSISEQLLIDLNNLLLKFNIYSKISCMRKKEEKKIIMGREVTIRPKWQMQTYGSSYNRMKKLLGEQTIHFTHSKFIACEDYDLLQIKSIEEIDYKGNVYNLETDDNHTYLTEIGSVHNCEFMEEGVLVFPSKYFEPEKNPKTGKLTGRWNLNDYTYIESVEEMNQEKVIEITEEIKNGATFSAGLDLGRQKDNTVYIIIRTDIRPIKIYAKIKFKLGTDYKEIARAIGLMHRAFQPTDFNIDYTNEKAFIEMLQENEVPVIVDQKKGRGAIQFTNKNKNEMVTTAQILFEKFHLQLPKHDDSYISEFMNQQFEIINNLKKFFHPSNEHDDSLWATLLALKNITYLGEEEITGWSNPWEKHDEKVGRIEKTNKVLVATSKLRDRNRGMYIPAEMKRGMRY